MKLLDTPWPIPSVPRVISYVDVSYGGQDALEPQDSLSVLWNVVQSIEGCHKHWKRLLRSENRVRNSGSLNVLADGLKSSQISLDNERMIQWLQNSGISNNTLI